MSHVITRMLVPVYFYHLSILWKLFVILQKCSFFKIICNSLTNIFIKMSHSQVTFCDCSKTYFTNLLVKALSAQMSLCPVFSPSSTAVAFKNIWYQQIAPPGVPQFRTLYKCHSYDYFWVVSIQVSHGIVITMFAYNGSQLQEIHDQLLEIHCFGLEMYSKHF